MDQQFSQQMIRVTYNLEMNMFLVYTTSNPKEFAIDVTIEKAIRKLQNMA